MPDIITTLHPENDENVNLYPNIKKGNIPNKAIDRNKLDDGVNSLLDSINELKPSGVDTSAHILAFTSNTGIWVGSDTGYWYYWNGTQYVSGGNYISNGITIDNDLNPISDNPLKNKTITNTLFKASDYNDVTLNFTEQGYYIDDSGGHVTYSDIYAAQIPVTPGQTYRLSSKAFYNACRYIIFRASTALTQWDTYRDAAYHADTVFTVPSDGAYMIIQVQGSSNIADVKLELASSFEVDMNKVIKLNGTWLFDGDSICYGAGYNGGYAKILGDNNPDMVITNNAVSGTTITPRQNRTDSILERIDANTNEYDYIVLEGGVNDAWNSEIELGDTFYPHNQYGEKTPVLDNFTNALETLLYKAHTKWPNSYIFFIIPHLIDPIHITDYMDRIEQCCIKYGIILIDLRKWSGYSPYPTTTEYFSGGDGVHPNFKGYNKFYIPYIESILRRYK